VNRNLRGWFWIESVLAFVSGLLCLITPISPDWIELVSGWDPDQHNGSVEWFIAAALLVVCVVMITLARIEWRRSTLNS
jgi:hypothetical protein